MDAERLQRLDLGLPRSRGPVDLRAAMAAVHIPGAGIALIRGGTIADTVHAGVLRAGTARPVTADTRFQAGSISKTVAAVCALRLVADGVLDLDEDVNGRLTSWRIPANGGWQPRVTLRQLLSHTAGTTVRGFTGYPVGTPLPSVPEVLCGRGNSLPVLVADVPGLRHRYSGGGYTIVQQLLTDVTGRDYSALATELVLEPAGLTGSTFTQLHTDGTAASGHHAGPVVVPGGHHLHPELAAAGLWSTAVDLARFLIALRASFTGGPGALLPREVAGQMLTDRPYGLGLARFPHGTGHSGDTQGFAAHAAIDPATGDGLVVMTNGAQGHTLVETILGGPSPAGGSPAPGHPGHYGDVLVKPDGDDLVVTFPGQQPLRARATGRHRWSAVDVNTDLTFDGDALVVVQDGAEIRFPARQPAALR